MQAINYFERMLAKTSFGFSLDREIKKVSACLDWSERVDLLQISMQSGSSLVRMATNLVYRVWTWALLSMLTWSPNAQKGSLLPVTPATELAVEHRVPRFCLCPITLDYSPGIIKACVFHNSHHRNTQSGLSALSQWWLAKFCWISRLSPMNGRWKGLTCCWSCPHESPQHLHLLCRVLIGCFWAIIMHIWFHLTAATAGQLCKDKPMLMKPSQASNLLELLASEVT